MFKPPTYFYLPDTLVDWPWPRRLHPNYPRAKFESTAWVESFSPFEPKGQDEFNLCDLNLLACLTFCLADDDGVRVGCDLMKFYFVYDEYTDVVDGPGARRLADIALDAMRNPTKPRPEGESVIGEMARQLWEHASALVEPDAPCLERFLATFDAYTTAVVQEANDRVNGRMRNIEEYLVIRRDTCGVKPTFSLVEFGLGLSNEVLEHPTIAALTRGATELIAVINDLNSYVLEQARGLDCHNVVTAVMHELGVDVAGAMTWLENYTKRVGSQFLADMALVPSWGAEIDEKVKRYIDGLGYWVRGNDTWSFETKRYFGEEGLEVQKSRKVKYYQEPKQGFVRMACRLDM